MSVNGLQQLVRTSIAKTKDAALGTPSTATPAAGSSDAAVSKVARPSPVQASIAHASGPAVDAMRAQIARRGDLPAVVVAALGGNRYLVDIDGKQEAVVLEGAAVSGGKPLLPGTELRLVAAREMAQAAALPGQDAKFSPLAKLVAAASREDPREHSAPRPALEPARMPAPNAPVAPDPAASAEVARSLKASVDSSGLFYESHVAEWAEGRRSIETIRSEPQALLGAALEQSVDGTGRIANEAKTALGTIVREQLQALHAQQVAWRGELWPGQDADIAIGRDPNDSAPPEAQVWRARLALELPRLGRVEVRLALTGRDLALGLASDGDTRETLSGGRGSLVDRLAARGLVPQMRFDPLGARGEEPQA